MTLNEIQVNQVKSYIHHAGIDYIDMVDEITDHICSQIEHHLQKGLSFDGAFVIVKQRWNPLMRKETSYWFGLFWVRPRIILSKSVHIVKSLYIKTILVSLLICPILYFIVENNILSTSQLFDVIVISNIFIVFLAFITWFKLLFSRYHSVYRFLFISGLNPWMSVIMFYMFYMFLEPEISKGILPWMWFILYMILALFYFDTAWKHFNYKRQLKMA